MELIDRAALLALINDRNINTCNGKLSCLQMKRMVELSLIHILSTRWFVIFTRIIKFLHVQPSFSIFCLDHMFYHNI